MGAVEIEIFPGGRVQTKVVVGAPKVAIKLAGIVFLTGNKKDRCTFHFKHLPA